MTLTQTLQIEERYLQFQDLRAIAYCEKRWQEEGKPTTKWAMVNFLERMLQELQQNGIGYPKVLLLRKKETQLGTFNLPELGQEPEQAECSCYGGWLITGTPCPCPKGEPRRVQLRKWGMNV